MRGLIGPGPGKYKLPSVIGYDDHDLTKWRSPQYSMPGRYRAPCKVDNSKISQYNIRGMTCYGKAGPPSYSAKVISEASLSSKSATKRR